jgi:WD repeat-containing protein 48
VLGLEAILSQPLNPPPYWDAPPLELPPNTTIILSEKTDDARGWSSVYHGVLSTLGEDVEILETAAPLWLLEFVLASKANQAANPKFNFLVTPWIQGSEPATEDTSGR